MKKLLLSICTLSIISCSDRPLKEEPNRSVETSKKVQLDLIDSLGTVSFSIPTRYDTSVTWLHRSDCGKPCDQQKYRYQPKILPVDLESGLVWKAPKDSVERFTISHTLEFPFHEGDTGKNINRHNALKGRLASDPDNPAITFDTIQKIDDRYYCIVAMDKDDSIQSRKLVALTTINANEITFSFELKSSKNDSISKNFIKNSLELLKTIRISKGQ